MKIKGFSENVVDETGLSEDKIYALDNFCSLLDPDIRELIFNYFVYKLDKKTTRVILLHNKVEYYSHAYKTGNHIIIELERKYNSIEMPIGLLYHFQNDIKMSEFSTDVLISVVKRLTGFDRVMMYKFNTDWTGVVISENSDYDVKFNGVYFHETDVPAYVRGLYCKNPTRYIYDATEFGVSLIVKHTEVLNTLDSRDSELIATVESHSNYLASIKCVSSFSIAILVDLKLWGVVICHHPERKYISPFIRQECYNFVSMYSENLQNTAKYNEVSINDYIYKLYKISSIFNFVAEEEMRIIFEHIIKEIKRITMTDEIIGSIKYVNTDLINTSDYLTYFITQNFDKIPETFYSNNVADDFYKMFGVKIPCEIVSCLVIIKLDGDWVGFVKKGVKQPVKWAGKNTLLLRDDKKVMPRNNFEIVMDEYTVITPYTLSRRNINYIKQILMYFVDKINKRNYFMDYFIFHDTEERSMNISSIVHEIRNPLNGIIGLFDIINKEKVYNQEYIDDGIKISRQLLNLTTNIIDLSRYTYNKNVNFCIIDWGTIIKDAISTYRYVLNPGVSFVVNIDKNIPDALSDNTKIKQIFNNLISNAVKYTKSGTITLQVHSVSIADGVCWTKISVYDTGVGIPLEKQVKLFRTFEQSDSDFIHSSGIGLILCSQIIGLLNGYIKFESEPGVGSRFDVYLPMRVVASSSEDTTEDTKLIDTGTENKKIKNILIVDDNYINIKVLEYRLLELGYNVYVAGSGEEAIKVYDEHTDIDIIFMDLQMPGIDGIQATSILREQKLYSKKIYAVTGHSYHERFYLNKGFDGVIIKPVMDDKLIAVLD
jgi:light-regulated signal transduction histidine kinase (bacteriophytochrome)